MGFEVQGPSGNKAEVDSSNNLRVRLPTTVAEVGSLRMFSEVDPGTITGAARLRSPRVDEDGRMRTSADTVLDSEQFGYTAQNTGKHTFANTTMAATWTTGQFTTNSGNITTTTTGVSFGTYAQFPAFGGGVLRVETIASFNGNPTTNTLIDFGLFVRGAANPFAPTDGAYFRLDSGGLKGVLNINGTETEVGFTFAYTIGTRYRWLIVTGQSRVDFWVNDVLYVSIPVPTAAGLAYLAGGLPYSIRHAIAGGAAGAALSLQVTGYSVLLSGLGVSKTLGETGNAVYGSYQGLSGGTMGSLANYANSANPTAVVPTNTTAALGVGLGGQVWETDTLAVTTDGVILSYQVPAGTASVQGRRLRLSGVKIESFVQTALTGGGYNAQWSLAFGHTAVSLATVEAAATKAPRRIALGVQAVASAAAALVKLETVSVTFQNPVYVDPGHFVALVKKKVGTAPSAGVIAHVITYDYSWE